MREMSPRLKALWSEVEARLQTDYSKRIEIKDIRELPKHILPGRSISSPVYGNEVVSIYVPLQAALAEELVAHELMQIVLTLERHPLIFPSFKL